MIIIILIPLKHATFAAPGDVYWGCCNINLFPVLTITLNVD